MDQWTQAYVDSLPDANFLSIAPGGSQDSDGKTTPRSLRQLPYKDAEGTIDRSHLSNAADHLDQIASIPTDEKEAIRTRIQELLDADTMEISKLTALPDDMLSPILSPLKLDATGALPTRFPIFVTVVLQKIS